MFIEVNNILIIFSSNEGVSYAIWIYFTRSAFENKTRKIWACIYMKFANFYRIYLHTKKRERTKIKQTLSPYMVARI